MLAKAKLRETRSIFADSNPSYPHAKHFALEVDDNSMDRAGIVPGRYKLFALCVDFASAGLTIQHEKIYALRRSYDQGKTHETIIRRAAVYRDRIEYHPESSEPDYAVLKVVTGSRVDDGDAEIEPYGLVYGTQQIFY